MNRTSWRTRRGPYNVGGMGFQGSATLLARCWLRQVTRLPGGSSFLSVKSGVGLPILPNKNTGCPVKAAFQMNIKS